MAQIQKLQASAAKDLQQKFEISLKPLNPFEESQEISAAQVGPSYSLRSIH
jgi:hypothetical protein